MYIPLRVHSVFNKGRGGLTIEELMEEAFRRKISALNITDSKLYGWGKFKTLCREYKIKPIFSTEVSLGGETFIIIIKEKRGYENLCFALNRKKFSGEGLIFIWIPREETKEVLKREIFAKDDIYIGADFINFNIASNISESTGIPLVWVNPVKFIKSPELFFLLRAIHKKEPYPKIEQNLKKKIDKFSLLDGRAIIKMLGEDSKRALLNTFEISDRCSFSFENIIPPLPSNILPFSLRELVMNEIKKRRLSYKEIERASKELEAVERSGFSPFILVAYELIKYAKKNEILFNLRGSGASSYILYLLGMSWINPIEQELYFERFLNAGRPDPPDLDIDFDSRRRDEVMSYLLEKYGKNKLGIAFVSTIKNFKARSALYLTSRAFGLSPEESRFISGKVPYFLEPEELKSIPPPLGYDRIWKMSSLLHSVFYEISLHVGGVLLTPPPIERYSPVEKSLKGYPLSPFDKETIEDLKMIKLDLLSVRGLSAISSTMEKLKIKEISSDDRKTYELISSGETMGCFQIESPAMMNMLKRMKPVNIDDLTISLALIRPGPSESGMKEGLLRRRGNIGSGIKREEIFLETLIPETEGILLYEEQVMQIGERLSGLPPEKGDTLRRALKGKEDIEDIKEEFYKGALLRGYSQKEIDDIWNILVKFSSYSFNKAHSASYAFMAYRAAYLKAHFPLEFMTSVLNAGGGYYPLWEYIEEIKRKKIPLFPPDVNKSLGNFSVENNGIRVGFSSIKGMSTKLHERIFKEREKNSFESLEDFLIRIKPTPAELMTLIDSGCLDSLDRRENQIVKGFGSLYEDFRKLNIHPSNKGNRDWKKVLGFNPFEETLDVLNGKRPSLRIKDLKNIFDEEIMIFARLVDVRPKYIKNSKIFFFLFEDETGLLEGIGEKPPKFLMDNIVFTKGRVKNYGERGVKLLDCQFLKSNAINNISLY